MDTILMPRDVMAVYFSDKLSFYARVEEILPDVKRGWRQLRFLVLGAPPHEVTWILEPSQIDGEEFTMGGTKVRIERLPDPVPTPGPDENVKRENDQPDGEAKVIAFPGKAKK